VQPNEEAPLNSVAGSYNVYCKLNLFIFYTDFRKDHLVTVTVTVILTTFKVNKFICIHIYISYTKATVY
jgi:hypothetical protein